MTTQSKAGARLQFPSFITSLFKFPPSVMLALLWMVLMAITAVLAPYITPYEIAATDLRARLLPPAFLEGGKWIHILGTDQLGRDVLSRLIFSIRTSMTVGVMATFIAASLGLLMGFLAARARGRIEQFILMLIDVQAAMPFMIVALAVLAFFGNNLLIFTILLGFFGWERIARLARGLAMSASAQGYTIAVEDLGGSQMRIYTFHILPNVASSLIVAITLNFPEVILLESGLSFLGLGVQPPLSSLGNMVGGARDFMERGPWLILIPSLVIMLTALSISIVGDALRDKSNPSANRL